MSKAAGECPFSEKHGCLFVKDLEKRWGLTLVSFLPRAVQKRIQSLQGAISTFPYLSCPPAEPEVQFYAPEHLHCTHLTLMRSNAWRPVRDREFVRSSHQLSELFDVIHHNSSKMKPLSATLDNLVMSKDGVSIVLTGACSDAESRKDRTTLLRNLNNELESRFHLSTRPWDRDESKFHTLHCRIGFLKRQLEVYPAFLGALQELAGQLDPISFSFEVVVLVHHRRRSLEPPHEGEFEFPLGRDIRAEGSAAMFASRVNLR